MKISGESLGWVIHFVPNGFGEYLNKNGFGE